MVADDRVEETDPPFAVTGIAQVDVDESRQAKCEGCLQIPSEARCVCSIEDNAEIPFLRVAHEKLQIVERSRSLASPMLSRSFETDPKMLWA